MRRRLKRAGRALFLLLIALTLFLGVTHEGRAAVKTALFIPQVFNVGVSPLNWFTPDPIVERVTFPTPHGPATGEMYRPPGEGPYAAALLFPGVAPRASSDPRVIRLSNALARSNMVTFIYWSPSMAAGHMLPEDVDNLVAAFRHLYAQDYVDKSRVGMGGFSVGASFSLMAAAEEPIRDQVAFVYAFGPYYDLRDTLAAISSETASYDGETRPWKPAKLSRDVLITNFTRELPEPEGSRLRDAFTTGHPLEIAAADLSSQGKAVYDLFQGVPAEETLTHFSRTPQSLQDRMLLISPSQRLDGLTAPVMIMHDRQDRMVPVFESRRLRDALEGRGEFSYTEFGLFDHVTPQLRLAPMDTAEEMVTLFLRLHSILMQAT